MIDLVFIIISSCFSILSVPFLFSCLCSSFCLISNIIGLIAVYPGSWVVEICLWMVGITASVVGLATVWVCGLGIPILFAGIATLLLGGAIWICALLIIPVPILGTIFSIVGLCCSALCIIPTCLPLLSCLCIDSIFSIGACVLVPINCCAFGCALLIPPLIPCYCGLIATWWGCFSPCMFEIPYLLHYCACVSPVVCTSTVVCPPIIASVVCPPIICTSVICPPIFLANLCGMVVCLPIFLANLCGMIVCPLIICPLIVCPPILATCGASIVCPPICCSTIICPPIVCATTLCPLATVVYQSSIICLAISIPPIAGATCCGMAATAPVVASTLAPLTEAVVPPARPLPEVVPPEIVTPAPMLPIAGTIGALAVVAFLVAIKKIKG